MNHSRISMVLVCIGSLLSTSLLAQTQPKPDKRLQQKISIQVDAKPAGDVLRELGEKYKLPMDFDPSVIAGDHGQSPFTLTADGLTLGSVIHLLCESNNLVSTVEKGRLLVTTPEADEKNLIVREYPLAALGAAVNLEIVTIALIGLTSGHWMVVDQEGGEVVAMTPQSLTIRQTRPVHAELQSLFDQLSAAVAGRARVPSALDRAEQLIVRKLQTPSQLTAGETSLAELLDQMLKKNGVPFWIDLVALADDGIDWTKLSSTVEGKKMTPSAKLDAIASEHKLSWRVADEVVQITAAAKADEQFSCRLYDVRNSVGPNRSIAAIMGKLTSNQDLGPWMTGEGEGGAIFPIGTVLVVRQTAKSHAKIAKLLK